MIISNKAKCLKCGDIIESKHIHDFVWCSCKAISVDGGKEYLKRSGNVADFEDMSIIEENGIIISNKNYTPNKLEDSFEFAMKEFDWARVKSVMLHLNWGWGGEGVPTIEKMKTTVRSLFKEVLKYGNDCSTGGFTVSLVPDEFSEYGDVVRIEFVLESIDGYGY